MDMSIANWKEKIKYRSLLPETKERLFVVIMIILVGSGSYGLGRLSALEKKKTPLRIETNGALLANVASSTGVSPSPQAQTKTGKVLASKNGKKYYYPSCSGAQRISEANKIWFPTEADAEKLGYTIASGCKNPNP